MAKINSKDGFDWDNFWPLGAFAIVVLGFLFVFFHNRKSEEGAVSVNELFKSSPANNVIIEEVKKNIPAPVPPFATLPPETQPTQENKVVVPPLAAVKSEPVFALKPEFAEKKSYAIQIFAFKDFAQAQKALEELKKKNYMAYIVTQDLKEKGIWHKVWVEKFATKDQATQALQEIKKDYKDSFIVSQ